MQRRKFKFLFRFNPYQRFNVVATARASNPCHTLSRAKRFVVSIPKFQSLIGFNIIEP